jgi:hypothetical protein
MCAHHGTHTRKLAMAWPAMVKRRWRQRRLADIATCCTMR